MSDATIREAGPEDAIAAGRLLFDFNTEYDEPTPPPDALAVRVRQLLAAGAAAEGERESLAIVQAILALARGLRVETTAEGVETEAQAAAMRQLGCDELQDSTLGARPRPTARGGRRGDRRRRA